MRLLMLSWRGISHPKAGGAEVYTERLLQGLVERGYQATWFSSTPGREIPSRGGIRRIHAGNAATVYVEAMRFLRLHARDYDVVVDQINTLGFLTPFYSPVPTVALIHQLAREVWHYETGPVVRHIGYRVEPLLLRAYRRTPFVTVSESTLQDLRQLGWEGRGIIARNGVEPGRFEDKTPHPTLVWLGRLGARAKRLDHAIAALQIVRQKYPDAVLRVIGRGDPPAESVPGVFYYPSVDDAERDRLLASSWLLLATSVREGWGRMVLEAAACGTPAVVYDVPGLHDAVVHGKTGLVVSPSPRILADAIRQVLSSPRMFASLSAEALRQSRAFRWPVTVERWDAFLRELVQERGGRRAAEG